MSINLAETNQQLTQKFDTKFVQDAVTGFLIDNTMKSDFVQAGTVLVPELYMSGAGDYSDDNGFAVGSIAVNKRPYTLPMRRGRKLKIGQDEVQDMGLEKALTSGSGVMSIFQKKYMAPEFDAYNLSSIADAAGSFKCETLTADTAYGRLVEDLDTANENASDGEKVYCFVRWDIYSLISKSSTFQRYVDVANFKKGEIDTELKTINEVGLIRTPRKRMYSAFDYLNGYDVSQTQGGFQPHAGATPINWIITNASATKVIVKTETIRTWTPQQNKDALSYEFDFYKRYGCLNLYNQRDGIVCSHE